MSRSYHALFRSVHLLGTEQSLTLASSSPSNLSPSPLRTYSSSPSTNLRPRFNGNPSIFFPLTEGKKRGLDARFIIEGNMVDVLNSLYSPLQQATLEGLNAGRLSDQQMVRNAVARGAVCLDGSPPAYHLHRGSGTGIDSWMHTQLGSSKKMVENLAFSAILSNKKQYKPDFYNWNRLKIRYCDGSSFTGDVQAVNPMSNKKTLRATNLHFRGARVWLDVMQELLAKGMRNAENAVLSGCSAGGLASLMHCDSFRALLLMGAKILRLQESLSKYEESNGTSTPQVLKLHVDLAHLVATRDQELRTLSAEYVAENERLRAILGEWSMRAANGDMAYPRMRSAAKRRGLEITSLSRPKASDFREFDLILAMDDQNKGILKAYNVWKARGNFPPDADKKVKLICSYCKKHNDKIVPDPYYGGAQGFEKVLDLLEDACESLVDGITAEN